MVGFLVFSGFIIALGEANRRSKAGRNGKLQSAAESKTHSGAHKRSLRVEFKSARQNSTVPIKI